MPNIGMREMPIVVGPKPALATAAPAPHPTLRHGQLRDVDTIMELASKLHTGSPMEKIGVSFPKVRGFIETLCVEPKKNWVILISHENDVPVGCLIAHVFTPVFTENKVACEVFWYLDENHRKSRRGLDMMEAYEYWAKLQGCVVAQYGWLVSSPDKMKLLYERNGAELAEQLYYKVL